MNSRHESEASRIVLTVTEGVGGLPRGSFTVSLACVPDGLHAIEATWDVTVFLPNAADEEAGRRVARMVMQMRRLGCVCPLDLQGLDLVRAAISRARR